MSQNRQIAVVNHDLWTDSGTLVWNRLKREGKLCLCCAPTAELMEPLSTAAASIAGAQIAKLAFDEFIKSAAGEAARKLTGTTFEKLKQLRHLIWNQLRGNPEAQAALTAAEVETVGDYLQIAMREDPDFAEKIRLLAHEITLELNQDNSVLVQNNYGGTNFQTKVDGGSVQQGTIHNYYGTSKD